MAVLIAGIPVFMYPILKKYNEALALGHVVFRNIEVVIFTVGAISLLTLLTLSQEFVIAGTPDASYFQTLATLLLAVREWGGGVFATIVFSLSALILNYILYRSKLIPRWLSGWGLIGATLALQEMVLAVWLIVKGFNSSTIASGSLKTDTKEVK
jgi:hypothetical protein